MGHRAYVAYEQQNGTFNLHYSHWGAHDLELCSRIDENHPLGGPNDLEPGFLTELTQTLTNAAKDQDLEISGRATERQDDKCVEPEPGRTNITIEAVVEEATDSGIESLYVVEQDFTVHGYSIEHINFDGESIGNLLFDPRYVNSEPIGLANMSGFIRGVQAQLDNLVSDRTLTIDEAHEQFLDTVLSKFSRGLNKHVLAHSTVVPNDTLNEYRNAFIECGGQTRLFGVMIPQRYSDIQPWQIPKELSLPPTYEQFSELVDAIPDVDESDASQQTFDSFDSGTPDRSLDTPSNGELPDVSVPTLPFESDVRVNGNKYNTHDMTPGMRDEFQEYMSELRDADLGLTKVHECDDCYERDDGYENGYLTTSSNVDEYKNPYSCPNSWTVESVMTHALTGLHGPEAWDVALTVNGDTDRIIRTDSASEDREYTIIVRAMEEYEYNGEITTESTVSVTPSELVDETESNPYPVSKPVSGETDGKSWEATLTIHQQHAELEWARTKDGDVREFAYRESVVDGEIEQEPLGFLPVDADTDADDVTVEAMDSSVRSRSYEKTCENEEFTRVWPASKYTDRTVNPNAVDSSDVPNTAQHLTQLQGDVEDGLDADMLERWVAIAAYHTWDTYGADPRFTDSENSDSPENTEAAPV